AFSATRRACRNSSRIGQPSSRIEKPSGRIGEPSGRIAMLEDELGGQLTAMAVLRAFPRPMLASIFIIQNYDLMRNPDRVVKAAEPVVRPIASRVPVVPDDTEQAVRLNGAAQFVAGSLLAVGWLPHLSTLALAVTLVPTTVAGHR